MRNAGSRYQLVNSEVPVEEKEQVVKQKRWPNMLPEILEMISDHLPLRDYLLFRFVCKNWRAAAIQRANITKFPRQEPWLIIYDLGEEEEEAKCLLYCRFERCSIILPDLIGATCIISKDGWLLARRADHIFFYNPFSLEKINLPNLSNLGVFADVSGTFTCHPTSPDCTVYIIYQTKSTLELVSCRSCGFSWSRLVMNNVPQVPGAPLFVNWCKGDQLECLFSFGHAFLCDLNNKSWSSTPLGVKRCLDVSIAELVKFVYSDLSKKFGGKKSVISFSQHKNKVNTFRYSSSSSFGCDSKSDLKLLKATFIDPLF